MPFVELSSAWCQIARVWAGGKRRQGSRRVALGLLSHLSKPIMALHNAQYFATFSKAPDRKIKEPMKLLA
ncbi:MAG TPA: hypothetical protein V6D06_14940 [Trichocoleus sp.]